MWNDRKPILFVLVYNIFSQGGGNSIGEGLGFPIYLYKLSCALQTGDSPILYFSRLVLWIGAGHLRWPMRLEWNKGIRDI
jgi:hypothetical protein